MEKFLCVFSLLGFACRGMGSVPFDVLMAWHVWRIVWAGPFYWLELLYLHARNALMLPPCPCPVLEFFFVLVSCCICICRCYFFMYVKSINT
ncbi:hypothetical protein BDV95DRAFT_585896 [Massariosphaeria phaeospora]|uniref:Uncharacterized protein n=1 Tax=Massariosphaeria phaeospora TaxID=100035 RepID=A0A7C8I6N9_9PLEO|nr:hypothetical protein BDV95DRAFT_585896 [Massariosphaeria phaeospora]